MAKKSVILLPVSIGQWDGTDKQSCTVRALANATDMPFDVAKALLKKHGRKDNNGCYSSTYEPAYAEAGLHFVGWFGGTIASKVEHCHSKLHKDAPRHKGMTLATFCKTYSRGSYVVITKGHAVCVRGGHIIDHGPLNGAVSVLCAWSVKP